MVMLRQVVFDRRAVRPSRQERSVRDVLNTAIENIGVGLSTLGGGVALAAGIAPWVVENHILISAVVGVCGLLVGVCGLRIQIRRDAREAAAVAAAEAREREAHALRVAAHEARMLILQAGLAIPRTGETSHADD